MAKKVKWDELKQGDTLVSWLTGSKRTVKRKYEDCVVVEERKHNGEVIESVILKQYIDGSWEVEA